MKDQEKSKPTKKKILLYYLILAACILVIAAITLAVVFSVRMNSQGSPTLDVDQEQPGPDDDDPDDDSKDTSTATVFIFPVANVDVTQKQDLWYDQTLKMYYMHEGVDFIADAGTNVLAAIDGTVKEISVNDRLYGGVITIEHENNVTTVYRYVDPLTTLKVGDKVNRGDVIGAVAAATGAESEDGAHLHFEVYANGVLADPDDYLGTEK